MIIIKDIFITSFILFIASSKFVVADFFNSTQNQISIGWNKFYEDSKQSFEKAVEDVKQNFEKAAAEAKQNIDKAVHPDSIGKNIQKIFDETKQNFDNTIVSYQQYINDTKINIDEMNNVTVGFHLYTKLNPKDQQDLQTGNAEKLKNSHFNASNQVKIVIHGYTEHYTSYNWSSQTILRGFQCQGGDFNVILVDYNSIVLNNTLTDYFIIHASRVPTKVASHVTEFIEFLKSATGITNEQIDLIGFSLGCQISALAAKNVIGKLNSIIALDPAAPLYSTNPDNLKLIKDDAVYVEAIHSSSCSGLFYETSGQADIYVNYGKYQPPCHIPTPQSLISDIPCDHKFAFEFFADSLCKTDKNPDKFYATECSKTEIEAKSCIDDSKKKKVVVGGDPPIRKSGIYNVIVTKLSEV